MNKVCLVGRLTAKPELRYTGANIPYVRFTVAANRGYNSRQGQPNTDFIGVIAWRKSAENIANYLDKGSMVSLEGHVETNNFTDKNGNKKYNIEIVAESIRFLDVRKKNDKQSIEEINNNKNTNEDPFADFGEMVSMDDNFLD